MNEMDSLSETLGSDDLLPVLRLMPGELICELVGKLGRSELVHATAAFTSGSGNLKELLKEIDIGVRRLAVHKVAAVIQPLPSYRDALRRLCTDGGVELAPEDTAAEMERKLLVRTYEQRDGNSNAQGKASSSPWNVGRQAFSGILTSISKAPIVRRTINRAAQDPKFWIVATSVIAVVTLAAVGNRLAGPAYARLEDCVRIIAEFRQAELFELIVEGAL
jgi:hypothetical protein